MIFPEVMRLLLGDLQKLGLMSFVIEEISDTYDIEFFVHLRKTEYLPKFDDDSFYANREILLRKISSSLGAAPFREARKWWGLPRKFQNWKNQKNKK
jgi:hypothetical protein